MAAALIDGERRFQIVRQRVQQGGLQRFALPRRFRAAGVLQGAGAFHAHGDQVGQRAQRFLRRQPARHRQSAQRLPAQPHRDQGRVAQHQRHVAGRGLVEARLQFRVRSPGREHLPGGFLQKRHAPQFEPIGQRVDHLPRHFPRTPAEQHALP